MTTTTSLVIGLANESEYADLARLVDRDAPGAITNWDERFRNLKSIRIEPSKQTEFVVALDQSTGNLTGALVLSLGLPDSPTEGETAWGTTAWQHIEAIAVEDREQFVAVARQLMQHAEYIASRRALIGMYAQTQSPSPEQIAFYESCGFEVIPAGRSFDPMEPARMRCPSPIKSTNTAPVVACSTNYGRSRGRDWYRVI